MRKVFIILSLIIGLQFSYGQRSVNFVSPDRLYYEAKALYEDENYAACIDKIQQYKKTGNISLVEEADFLQLASDFYQGQKNMDYALKNHIDTYPTSSHRNEIYFMIGSNHFAKEEYRKAIFWFEKAKDTHLTSKQQDDYTYRLAISYLKTEQIDEARKLLSSLKSSRKYRDAANYYLGYIEYQRGNFQDALGLFNSVKNTKEFQPEVNYYIAQINFAQGRYSQAINEGKSLINANPGNKLNPEMTRVIGASYYYQLDYDNAVEYLKEYLSKSEDALTKDYYMTGMSYYHLNNFDMSIFYLNKSNPENDELGQNINFYLGQSYLNTGDSGKALMCFEAAARMDYNPDMTESAQYNYAMLLHQNSVSAFGESVTALENFLNTYPNSVYSDNVNDALVEVYLTTNNYDVALASIGKIRNPGSKILQAKQHIYYYLGTVEFTNSNYEKAIDYFTSAITSGDYAMNEKQLSYYWRAESYYRLGDHNDAINDYNSFLNSGNKTADLYLMSNYNIAYCYFKQEKFNEAQQAFKAYIKDETLKTSTLADAYARSGDCYFYNRNFSDAEKAYNQAAILAPAMGDYAIFQRGYVMGLMKNYQAKVDEMDKLVKNNASSPYVPDALFEKGSAYIQMNKLNEAINTYQTLIDNHPNSALARKAGLQLGLLYYNNDQLLQAIKAYKNVVANYPGSEEAKVALQDLKSVYFDMNEVDEYVSYINSLGGGVRFDVTEQDSLTYLAAERTFLNGNYKEAQATLQKYLQTFPTGAFNVHAHFYLGGTYYHEKKYEPAKQEYTLVLDAGDNQFTEEAIIRLAEITYSEKKLDEALAYYERLERVASGKNNKEIAQMGIIRSAAGLKNNNTVISSANSLLEQADLAIEKSNEAKYYRGKAFFAIGEKALAKKDMSELAKDTRTAWGAEAKYLLAFYHFNDGDNKKAKDVINDYIKTGTPHQYWLAKSFILISDVLASEGDKLQAKQYLESLQNNYKNTDDDIHATIQDRLYLLNQNGN
ncbi:tetratricopeptide repeat protein [Bacteroidales bacterium OttesenSCG-928-I14]|nr:tetratricopeptide repeat protein [Bacteroidales bacterium OttesenSCG-928-I14]